MARRHVLVGSGLLLFAVIAQAGCDGSDGFAPAHELPALSSATPADGATVARTTWVVLSFDTVPAAVEDEDFELRCGGLVVPFEATLLEDGRVVVNPTAPLPDGAACSLRWRGPDGIDQLDLRVAERGDDAFVRYERNALSELPPLPDDLWASEDASTRTGVRIDIPGLDVAPGAWGVVEALREGVAGHDGWSPLGPWVVALDAAADPETLPGSPAESVDPLGTVALFDLEDGSRVPFHVWDRNETSRDGSASHVLLVWPARALDPGGRYGLVVTNRALVSLERPLEASPFTRAALDAPETDTERRAGDLADEILAVAGSAVPPVRRDDVALLLRGTIRSIDDVVEDHLAVWEQVRDTPAPSYTVTEVVAETDPASDVAAYVHGTWMEPDFVDASGVRLRRNATGHPTAEGTREVGFVLALPRASLDAPAPLVMFQHGQPGSAEDQVPCEARTHLAGAGFAVAGFTNYLNRDLAGEDFIRLILEDLLVSGSLIDTYPAGPLYLGEQLAFVRVLGSFAELDVLPIGSPDGVPDVDPSSLLYLGQSGGSGQAMSLLSFEPSILAAAINVSGGRSWSISLHQDEGKTYEAIADVFSDVTVPMFYAGIVLVQTMEDYSDPGLLARLVHRDPLELGAGGRRASILMAEGMNDVLVPPVSTRAAAWALGLPLVQPALVPEPFLDVVDGPVTANLGPTTTGGFVQFDPALGPPVTEYCAYATPDPADGHQYTQDAAAARALRIHFFHTALSDAAPTILDYSTL